MKVLMIIMALAFGGNFAFGQYALPQGAAQLNAGVGLSSWGIPIYVGFDYGAGKDVSVGGEVSFRSYHDDWKNKRYNHGIIGISGNVNFHFNSAFRIPRNWDFYAGLNLGFYMWNSDSGYEGDHVSGIGLGAQVGGRYYFSNSFGVNLEFGGGNAFSGGKFGITAKL